MTVLRLKRASLRAFTLVEMLTVIAITAILLTLIILPVVQAFNLTRSAQAFADAQDKARTVIERISREIGNSAGVLDNAGIKGQTAVLVPGRNGSVILPILMDYTKLDIVRPAAGDPARGPSGAFVDPDTGKDDPTLHSAKGQVVLPVTPGDTIVRWSIGLRNPLDPNGYDNPYDGLLMQRTGDRDNLYVLFRFEVQPYIWDNVNNRYVVNTKYFDVDPDSVVAADPFSGKPILDDPYFLLPGFDRFGAPLAGAALAAKQVRVQHWMSAGSLVTEVSRYDMIQPVYNKQNRGVVYDGNVPRLIPLAQFRPTAMGSEPIEGMAKVRIGTESENMDELASDVFRTKHGAWSSLLVRMWPSGWDRTLVGANDYLIGRTYNTGTADHFGIFLFDPDVDVNEKTDGLLLFDGTVYDWAVKNNLSYPFSRSLNIATMANAYNRARLLAYVVQSNLGRLVSSFEIVEVGDPNQPVPLGGNGPLANTGPSLSPIQNPNPPGTQFDPQYSPSNTAYEINSAFNKTWEQRPALRGGAIHRFVDLRVVAQRDGTPSPLDPNGLRGFAQARIVAGSETVIGPDQTPGPNYGSPIRYSRTTRVPGANQYSINYVDQPEPTDYSLLGFSPAEVAAFQGLGGAYSSGDFISAFFQPRYKAGYLELNSDPNIPLPLGNIQVTYRFQFSRAGDTFAADYDTRQLITVKLTIRNYPQSSLPNPQGITVAGTASARNVLR